MYQWKVFHWNTSIESLLETLSYEKSMVYKLLHKMSSIESLPSKAFIIETFIASLRDVLYSMASIKSSVCKFFYAKYSREYVLENSLVYLECILLKIFYISFPSSLERNVCICIVFMQRLLQNFLYRKSSISMIILNVFYKMYSIEIRL